MRVLSNPVTVRDSSRARAPVQLNTGSEFPMKTAGPFIGPLRGPFFMGQDTYRGINILFFCFRFAMADITANICEVTLDIICIIQIYIKYHKFIQHWRKKA